MERYAAARLMLFTRTVLQPEQPDQPLCLALRSGGKAVARPDPNGAMSQLRVVGLAGLVRASEYLALDDIRKQDMAGQVADPSRRTWPLDSSAVLLLCMFHPCEHKQFLAQPCRVCANCRSHASIRCLARERMPGEQKPRVARPICCLPSSASFQ